MKNQRLKFNNLHFSSLVYKSILEILFFLTSYIVGIIFITITGLLSPVAICAQYICAFLLTSTFRNYIWRHKILHKPIQKQKRVTIEFIFYIILLQIILILTYPLNSVVPETILTKTKIINNINNPSCDTDRQRKLWESIISDQIDYSKVKITQGGLMYNLGLMEKWGLIKQDSLSRPAMVFGNTIYFGYTYPLGSTNYSLCPLDYAYIHEMAHVWQIQHHPELFYGPNMIWKDIKEQYTQIFNKDILYNYGGESGLRSTKQTEKTFLDFGTEQQASIVEDMFSFVAGDKRNNDGDYITEEYGELLKYYVDDMKRNK